MYIPNLSETDFMNSYVVRVVNKYELFVAGHTNQIVRVKEIIKLHHEDGVSWREIKEKYSIPHHVVMSISDRYCNFKLSAINYCEHDHSTDMSHPINIGMISPDFICLIKNCNLPVKM